MEENILLWSDCIIAEILLSDNRIFSIYQQPHLIRAVWLKTLTKGCACATFNRNLSQRKATI